MFRSHIIKLFFIITIVMIATMEGEVDAADGYTYGINLVTTSGSGTSVTVPANGSTTFTVSLLAAPLCSQPLSTVKVSCSVSSSNYSLSPSTVEFTTMNYSTAQTVTVSSISGAASTSTITCTSGQFTSCGYAANMTAVLSVATIAAAAKFYTIGSPTVLGSGSSVGAYAASFTVFAAGTSSMTTTCTPSSASIGLYASPASGTSTNSFTMPSSSTGLTSVLVYVAPLSATTVLNGCYTVTCTLTSGTTYSSSTATARVNFQPNSLSFSSSMVQLNRSGSGVLNNVSVLYGTRGYNAVSFTCTSTSLLAGSITPSSWTATGTDFANGKQITLNGTGGSIGSSSLSCQSTVNLNGYSVSPYTTTLCIRESSSHMISVSKVSNSIGSGTSGSGMLSIVLLAAATADVTVSCGLISATPSATGVTTSTNTGTFVAASTLTFTSTNWNVAQMMSYSASVNPSATATAGVVCVTNTAGGYVGATLATAQSGAAVCDSFTLSASNLSANITISQGASLPLSPGPAFTTAYNGVSVLSFNDTSLNVAGRYVDVSLSTMPVATVTLTCTSSNSNFFVATDTSTKGLTATLTYTGTITQRLYVYNQVTVSAAGATTSGGSSTITCAVASAASGYTPTTTTAQSFIASESIVDAALTIQNGSAVAITTTNVMADPNVKNTNLVQVQLAKTSLAAVTVTCSVNPVVSSTGASVTNPYFALINSAGTQVSSLSLTFLSAQVPSSVGGIGLMGGTANVDCIVTENGSGYSLVQSRRIVVNVSYNLASGVITSANSSTLLSTNGGGSAIQLKCGSSSNVAYNAKCVSNEVMALNAPSTTCGTTYDSGVAELTLNNPPYNLKVSNVSTPADRAVVVRCIARYSAANGMASSGNRSTTVSTTAPTASAWSQLVVNGVSASASFQDFSFTAANWNTGYQITITRMVDDGSSVPITCNFIGQYVSGSSGYYASAPYNFANPVSLLSNQGDATLIAANVRPWGGFQGTEYAGLLVSVTNSATTTTTSTNVHYAAVTVQTGYIVNNANRSDFIFNFTTALAAIVNTTSKNITNVSIVRATTTQATVVFAFTTDASGSPTADQLFANFGQASKASATTLVIGGQLAVYKNVYDCGTTSSTNNACLTLWANSASSLSITTSLVLAAVIAAVVALN